MNILLGSEQRASLNRLAAYAETHPFTMDDLLDQFNHPELSPGIEPEFQIWIPDGFKVVYSFEYQQAGLMRHLSVSCDLKDRMPNVEATRAIMQILGFKTPLEKCMVFQEKIEPGHIAINILELVNE